VLRRDVEFGPIPGGDKPALKKPGAEKLASFFGLMPRFDDVATTEDWTGEAHGGEPFFYYRQKCNLYRGDLLVASADGSCNSWEKKYRYRKADRICPNCGAAAVFRSKNKPEWYCWSKKGGCGATFPVNDERITGQETGQVKNSDVAEQVNTILKMAQKRALVAAVLIATNASDYFTQDVDDFIEGEWQEVIPQNFTQAPPPPPEPLIQEPPSEKLPTLDYSSLPEPVRTMKNSKGTLYTDISSTQLVYMANALDKALRNNGLSDDEKAEKSDKLAAARAMLDFRAG